MQTIRKRVPLFLLSASAAFGGAGCSTLSAWSPDSPDGSTAVVEQIDPLLVAIEDATPGVPVLMPDGLRMLAGESYWAASGRNCRRARVEFPEGRWEQRLACEVDGRWQWFPVVTLPQTG